MLGSSQNEVSAASVFATKRTLGRGFNLEVLVELSTSSCVNRDFRPSSRTSADPKVGAVPFVRVSPESPDNLFRPPPIAH